MLINSHSSVKSSDGGVDEASDDGVKDKREHLERDDIRVNEKSNSIHFSFFFTVFYGKIGSVHASSFIIEPLEGDAVQLSRNRWVLHSIPLLLFLLHGACYSAWKK